MKVQVTGETGDVRPITGKTKHPGPLLVDPYCTYTGPLMGLHPDQPERAAGEGCWCQFCLHECCFLSVLICTAGCMHVCCICVYVPIRNTHSASLLVGLRGHGTT